MDTIEGSAEDENKNTRSKKMNTALRIEDEVFHSGDILQRPADEVPSQRDQRHLFPLPADAAIGVGGFGRWKGNEASD